MQRHIRTDGRPGEKVLVIYPANLIGKLYNGGILLYKRCTENANQVFIPIIQLDIISFIIRKQKILHMKKIIRRLIVVKFMTYQFQIRLNYKFICSIG
jgi:hypothetical protein